MKRRWNLGRVLAKAHAVAVLVALNEEENVSGTRLTQRVEGASDVAAIIAVARHLENAHLVRIEPVPGPFPGQEAFRIFLTDEGRTVAKHLQKAVEFYAKLNVPEPEPDQSWRNLPQALPLTEEQARRLRRE